MKNMEGLDKAWYLIWSTIIDLLADNYSLSISAHETKQCADQILFELLKKEYIDERRDIRSLNKIDRAEGNTEAADINVVKKHARTMHRSEYYREHLAKELEELLGYVPPELAVPNMKDPAVRSVGYQLSDYYVEQMKAMEDLKLLKHIMSKQITNHKTVPNYELEIEYTAYLDYFSSKFKSTQSDDDFILNCMLLFTTELKYHVVSVYYLADKLSQYQNSGSKNKFPDDYMAEVLNFYQTQPFYINEQFCPKENSLIMMKMEKLKELNPNNFYESVNSYIKCLKLCLLVKQMVMCVPQILKYIKQSSDEERKAFIKEHYPINTIFEMKPVWENKKELYIRKLYAALIQDIETPKIT